MVPGFLLLEHLEFAVFLCEVVLLDVEDLLRFLLSHQPADAVEEALIAHYNFEEYSIGNQPLLAQKCSQL